MGKESFIPSPRFAFVPKPLESKDRPELNQFPFNILFACWWRPDGFATYIPRIETYAQAEGIVVMDYLNENDLRAEVLIKLNRKDNTYIGRKSFDGEEIGMAYGKAWHPFFIHLTSLGCDRREHITIRGKESGN
jgi:hypothetical protein